MKTQFALSAAMVLGLVSSSSVHAHLRIGTYAGTNAATGAECTLEIRAVRFENNLRHPINERVEVTENGTRAWTLHHPAIVVPTDSAVGFSNETLEAAVGISGGAEAFVIEMSHEEGREGPTRFHSIHHDYRDANRTTRTSCEALAFRESR